MELRGLGVSLKSSGGFTGESTLRKGLGSEELLDWLKIDLNTLEIITVQRL